MVATFYKKMHPTTGEPYSITSIKRMCKTTKEGGTEIKDMDKALTKLGLKRVRTTLNRVLSKEVKCPIIVLIKDETPNTDHYVLIDGVFAKSMFSIIDPETHVTTYVGLEKMKELIRKYDKKDWIWEIRKIK
jgi:ABC-type bacteriocin/lantibiotic exporter with double-glycine peptidase domain